MPASLQFSTHCFMLTLLSNAVLAAVVTQAPLNALASQTGTGGSTGAGGGGWGPLVFLEQETMAISQTLASTKRDK